jgi:hypothetical protein
MAWSKHAGMLRELRKPRETRAEGAWFCQWTPCLLFIWNDNMREKREANANATWRELIRDRPRGDGV